MLHRHPRPAVAGCFLIGAVAGALATATGLFVLAGLTSPIPQGIRAAVTAALLAPLLVRCAGVIRLPLPERHHQIPREVFGTSPRRSAFRFAFELGLGFRTYVPATAPFAVAIALVFLTGSPQPNGWLYALCAAIGFGIGRSVIIVSRSLFGRAATTHPPGWLRASDLLACASLLVVTVQHAFVA